MRAVKGNKEYTIDESQQKSYQDAGFDIVGDDGQVTAYGRGKTVPYDEYVKAEIASLRVAKQEPAKKAESKKAGE